MKYNKIAKIVFYINKICRRSIPKEKIDRIVKDEFNCLTDEEKELKNIVNSLKLIFDNANQCFNNEILLQSYYLLTNNLLDTKVVDNLVKIYYENIDNSVYYLTSLIHLYILENIEIRNIEYAFIISEFIFLKKNKTLLIPREFVFDSYNQALYNKDFSKLIVILFEMEYHMNNSNKCIYDKKEMIKRIKLYKEYLIDTFNIKKLYLFGSFAKGTNNESSDIDFLVILDEALINVERLEQISLLQEYLSELFECSVDVLDFTFALKELGENEMEHIITLI